MFKKIAIGAVLTVLASSSFAGERGFYAGFDAGRSGVTDYPDSYTSAGVFAGYRFSENYAVENNFRHHGVGESIKFTQVGVSFVGTSFVEGEFNRFHVFGRLGVNAVKAVGCFEIYCGTDKYEAEPLIGVGIGYAFSEKVVGRIEAQRPMNHANNISASIGFWF